MKRKVSFIIACCMVIFLHTACLENPPASQQGADSALTEGQAAEGSTVVEGQAPPEGETSAEGQTPTEGEAPVEGQTPAEGEDAEPVWVRGTGDNWQEEAVDSAAQDIAEAPSGEIGLHAIPALSSPERTEYEGLLHLENVDLGVPAQVTLASFAPAGNRDVATASWQMVTRQYQIRVATEAKAQLQPWDLVVSLVLADSSGVWEGFENVPDMYLWRQMRGGYYKESAKGLVEVDPVPAWYNLTQGNPQYVWVPTDEKGASCAASVSYPIGAYVNTDAENAQGSDITQNVGLISEKEATRDQWKDDLEADPRTRGWLNPPPQSPKNPPEGYHYEYQGRTVVVDMLCKECTLPGMNTEQGYKDEVTDILLINNTFEMQDFVAQKAVTVEHVWKLKPNN